MRAFLNKYRLFLNLSLYFMKREIKFRIAGSIGGIFWSFAQPIMMAAIFIFLFSLVLKVKIGRIYSTSSFTLFMLTGFIPWAQFQEAIMRSSTAMIENRESIKKVYFPPGTIIVGISLAISLIYLIPFILLVAYCLTKLWLDKILILHTIPLVLSEIALVHLMLIVFSLGLGAIVSSISVYLRDTIQILPILLQVWFYITPIVYPPTMIPQKFRLLLNLNPWNTILSAYRELMLNGQPVSVERISLIALTSILAFMIGTKIFRYLKDGFPDVL